MLNRRQLRVKVMQTIYAMHQNGSDSLDKQEKFLLNSVDVAIELYLVILTTLTEIRKKEIDFIDKSKLKHLATKEELNPNLKFINNQVLLLLEESNSISIALETRKIKNWQSNDDTILALLQDVKQSEVYEKYMASNSTSFQEDKDFVADSYEFVIAPNASLNNYLEDFKLTWVDDIPVVNTHILKQLQGLKNSESHFKIPKVYKDEEDQEFALNLFRKTVLNDEKLTKEFADKTPSWDIERIAEIDTKLIKMAICEFLHFPSIPYKVTINEYLEIAKEYSTPKSSTFLNGILDAIIKELIANDRLKKTGRGLI